MGCNCTANLRADIIKRFFANQFNGKEFALELIRIVECQQDVMSRELEDWFKVWFRFPQDMLEEFLACVMKRQATMSDNLQKVIRARFFPTDQRMADDFIRVVLCSCCPAICGTDIDIVGIYQGDPVADGWYLRQGAGASTDVAEIVYIESDTITESRVCDSRIADYGHPNGLNSGYESPHYYNSGGEWIPMLEVGLKDLGSNDYEFTIWGADPFPYDIAGSTILVQYSTDGGTTWIDGGTADGTSLGGTFIPVTFNTGTNTFIYRTIVTLANGCQFYNPAPDTGSPSYGIYYATIDMNSDLLFTLLGSINAITPLDNTATAWADIIISMQDPYQTVAGRLGGIGISYSLDEAGGAFEVPFYLQIRTPLGTPPTELAVVLDSSGTPVDTSPQGVANVIKNYEATYNFVDINDVYIEGFVIFGARVLFNQIPITNPVIDQEVALPMVYYQIADPAFAFQAVINPTNIQFLLTTALPITDIILDITSGHETVPLIEI